jgi:hypothetical protein
VADVGSVFLVWGIAMHSEHFGAFVPLAWALLWFIFWGFIVRQRMRERSRILDMVEKASADGRTLPPEVLAGLNRRGQRSDLRTGLILAAVGIGLALGGVINFMQYSATHPNAQVFYGPYGLFPIPLLVGVAFLIMAWLRRGEQP